MFTWILLNTYLGDQRLIINILELFRVGSTWLLYRGIMIVFDIDGTLSIVGDRLNDLILKDWDSFYARSYEDDLNQPVADVLLSLVDSGFNTIYVTGRRESCRNDTLMWLKDNGLPHNSSKLYMRRNGDYRHDTEVKVELVKPFMEHITMVFEDRNSMVKKWRELGLTCFQVADGDF